MKYPLARRRWRDYVGIMSGSMFFAAAAACILTLAVLVFGVITFARGGEFNRKYSNKIMRARLAMQALAVVLILLTVWLARGETG